jgi:hypothetical protein
LTNNVLPAAHPAAMRTDGATGSMASLVGSTAAAWRLLPATASAFLLERRRVTVRTSRTYLLCVEDRTHVVVHSLHVHLRLHHVNVCCTLCIVHVASWCKVAASSKAICDVGRVTVRILLHPDALRTAGRCIAHVAHSRRACPKPPRPPHGLVR